MSFRELGLQPFLTDKCEQMGFTVPTPIQKQAIPIILQGGDVIGTAETGTGKTAAFLLPILQKLKESPRRRGTSVLILSPTRELANQTDAECRKFAPKGIRCAAIIGGAGYAKQIQNIKQGVDILIATPGRLMDFIEQGMIKLNFVDTLVLDEADRMLDMGFLPTIKKIAKLVPEERQTLFFSATMAQEIDRIARAMVTDPTYIQVNQVGKAAVLIEQLAYPVAQQHKMPLLLDILSKEDMDRVLVFTRTKRGADRLASVLEKWDHKPNRIHGDRSQSQRESALKAFKSGRAKILVATDVAARGIDIDSVSHVINYDVPAVPEDYVHRIGRTGRAGNKGRAITFCTVTDEASMRAIEKLTGQKLERVVLPNFGGADASPIPTTAKFVPKRQFRSSGRRRRF